MTYIHLDTYLFANPIDLGSVYTSRVTASITQTSDNLDDLFDSRTGDFDDAGSNFDGDTPANCNAHLEIALSNDNVTYTSFRNFVVGDYTARYYKFRVSLRSFDLSSTPVISAYQCSIDMPDRIFSGNDISFRNRNLYSYVYKSFLFFILCCWNYCTRIEHRRFLYNFK
jgi:hypothetical protein